MNKELETKLENVIRRALQAGMSAEDLEKEINKAIWKGNMQDKFILALQAKLLLQDIRKETILNQF